MYFTLQFEWYLIQIVTLELKKYFLIITTYIKIFFLNTVTDSLLQ